MTDPFTTLTAARPTDAELDAPWPAPRRTHVLARARATHARTARSRRRHVLALAAAATVAAGVVVPVVLDSGDATAADLHALARAAVSYDGPVLAEGTWLHERSTSLQRNSRILSDGAVLDDERETWTSWDGELYLRTHRPSAGWTSYDVLDEQPESTVLDPTPAFSASLPDDPAELRAYLDAHVSGSSSHDEALFEALRTLTTSHTLPPRTLAAALEVMAGVDGVDTTDRVVAGRPAVEVTFTQRYLDLLGTSTIVLDRATGQVLSTEEANPSSTYRSTTTSSDVVDAVPADVLGDFAAHGDGGVVCDADRPDCTLP